MAISKNNIYAFLLGALIVSQVFGLYGGALVPARILALLCLPLCLKKEFISLFFEKEKFIFLFIGSFVTYSIFLIVINQGIVDLNEFLYLMLNLLIFSEIIFFSSQIRNPYKVISFSFLIFVSLTLPIALIEIFTDFHLPVSYLDSDQRVIALGIDKKFASVTFGNYNQYVVILCLAAPFIFSLLVNPLKQKRIIKIWAILVLFIVFFILITNGSRGGILSFLITFVVFMYFFTRRNKLSSFFIFRLTLSAFLLIGFSIYYLSSSGFFEYLSHRVGKTQVEDDARLFLVEGGIQMILDSNLLGVGPGNFVKHISKYNLGIRDLPPHNMFLELLTQYGLLLFILFIYFMYKIYKSYRRINKVEVKFILINAILYSIIVFGINSIYLKVVYMWIFWGAVYSLTIKIRNRKNDFYTKEDSRKA